VRKRLREDAREIRWAQGKYDDVLVHGARLGVGE